MASVNGELDIPLAPATFGQQDQPELSPEQQAQAARVAVNSGNQLYDRIARASLYAPSARQQTQAEIINMNLLYSQLGNPFSVRRIAFPILRDMITDPMIAMGLFYIRTPLIRADWSIQCPDAQLAAAVDEALRPIVSWLTIKQCGALAFGYQPMVKRFKLGQLRSVYRDPHSDDPEADKETWSSSVQPLMWDIPLSLSPENCLPKWNERGEFNGFKYSLIPIPNPQLIGTAYQGEGVYPGFDIPLDWAMWRVNEQEENFGSIFGSPRIRRAYRYYWSYWVRWALADRSFENKADPAKIVYYPTDATDGLDPNDPDPQQPTLQNVQARALAIGQQARSGATLAMPGDFIRDENGKSTGKRKWEIAYLEGGENFDLLDKTFGQLDMLKWQALFLPGSIFNAGRSQGSGGGTGTSKNVSTPIEIFDESQQLLADEHDYEINEVMIPQFIAANFPEKIGTPCRKVTRGFGSADTEIVKQLIQLIGQTKGIVLPVDLRELLRQANIPLLTQQQQKVQEEKVAKEAEAMQPPVQPPEKVGMQGYNSGITKTPLGNVYVQPPQRIDLTQGAVTDYMSSLPDIPPYKDATVRSMLLRTRKLFTTRYEGQVKSFAEHLKDHTPLQLSLAQVNAPPPPEDVTTPQQEPQYAGLLPGVALATATAIVGAWFAQQPVDKTADLFSGIIGKVVARAGKHELHLSGLDPSVYNTDATAEWIDEYVSNTMNSVDETIRAEMVTFLTEELERTTDPKKIIEAAEDHFDETPLTHANRVARAATRDAYNFGMLRAGNDAGISQVQAHDASNGNNPDTDPKCVERDGKVMSIEQALGEEEHPNGTLYWTYLVTTDFSVEHVQTIPLHLEMAEGEQVHAAFDEESETLFVLDGTTREQEGAYALAVGSRLVLR